MELSLTKCEKSITVEDIKEVEQELGIQFPDSFKDLYLQYNGGEPSASIVDDPDGKRGTFEVRDFRPIKYSKIFKNNPVFTISGQTLSEQNKEELPLDFVIFAMDWRANLFCISKMDGKIYFYSRETYFDDNLTKEQNFTSKTLWLADSFSEFLSRLRVNEEKAEATTDVGIKKKRKKIKLALSDGGEKIKRNDIKKIEERLLISFPDSFKALYAKHNGGTPNKPIWDDPDSDWDYHEISNFIPMLHAEDPSAEPVYTLEEYAERLWKNGTLPKNLVPFATDWGDNLFCLSREDEKIYYFVRDVWSENLTAEENMDCNTQLLSSSFDEFLDKLTIEDEDL